MNQNLDNSLSLINQNINTLESVLNTGISESNNNSINPLNTTQLEQLAKQNVLNFQNQIKQAQLQQLQNNQTSFHQNQGQEIIGNNNNNTDSDNKNNNSNDNMNNSNSQMNNNMNSQNNTTNTSKMIANQTGKNINQTNISNNRFVGNDMNKQQINENQFDNNDNQRVNPQKYTQNQQNKQQQYRQNQYSSQQDFMARNLFIKEEANMFLKIYLDCLTNPSLYINLLNEKQVEDILKNYRGSNYTQEMKKLMNQNQNVQPIYSFEYLKGVKRNLNEQAYNLIDRPLLKQANLREAYKLNRIKTNFLHFLDLTKASEDQEKIQKGKEEEFLKEFNTLKKELSKEKQIDPQILRQLDIDALNIQNSIN